jgi:biopolymer transport protein ExbB
MSFDLAEVFANMQPFAILIVAVLGIMALASISVFVERIWVYWRSRKQSRKYGQQAAALLQKGDHAGLIKLAGQYKGCHLAQLLGGGMKTYAGAVNEPGELGPMELTRRELARQSETMSNDIRRGHSVLASVGSVSPFVGLLGTVIGIIGAFQGIAREGSGGLGAVSAGIAEALIVTAIGLMVAIPAVLAFNFLSTRADALLVAIDQSKGEFLDFLENHTPTEKAPVETRRPSSTGIGVPEVIGASA